MANNLDTRYSKLSSYKNAGREVITYLKCGFCMCCQRRVKRDWTVRIYYENLDLPATFHFMIWQKHWRKVQHNINYELMKNFNKRMRQRGYAFRFFCACEYGKHGKPHYHIIYFGLEINNNLLDCVELKKSGNHIYHCKEVYDILNIKTWYQTTMFGKDKIIRKKKIYYYKDEEVNTDFVLRIQKVDGEHGLTNYLTNYTTKKKWFGEMKKKHMKVIKALEPEWHRRKWKNILECIKCPYRLKIALYNYRQTKYRQDIAKANQEFNKIKEKFCFSLGMGFDSMLKRLDTVVEHDGVYIGGYLYNLPLSWLIKLCNMGHELQPHQLAWVEDTICNIEEIDLEEVFEENKIQNTHYEINEKRKQYFSVDIDKKI